jgi:hypothetical protein
VKLLGNCERFQAVTRGADFVSLDLEKQTQGVAGIVIVVSDKYSKV